ncbi:hypothetical protein [Polyangium jinanense]|uniref:Uncharacterized protein n=1 Tax=Polyangium jinanense TaxID=2829994 RepID=A0A9X3X144_9BACT|nr:hypothetical protein [Polyangium jinanense]MDC3982182.1 hypothetical protein [Polyangium jinanense]
MLELPRLDVDRQLNVGNAIAAGLAAPRPTPLTPTTLARGQAVVAVTLDLRAFSGPTPGVVDRATDTVITAFDRARADDERALLDSVVPLGPAQREALSRLRLIRTRVFPNGTDFIRRRMDLEWRALCDVRNALNEPEVAAAVDAQGLRPAVDHLLAHIDLYGRVIGQEAGPAGKAEERLSAAWHEAFKLFAAQVMLDYDKNPVIQKELLGAYEVQLDEQRAAARHAARARQAKSGEAAGSPPDGASSAEA